MTKTPPPDPAARHDPAGDARFFDDDYLRILAPFHPEAEARYEVAALREILGLAQDDRVLDVGCGWGRHLQLMQEAGHHVVGVDLSYDLLRHAADAPGPGPAVAPDPDVGDVWEALRLVAGDMLRLPLGDAAFDVVVNLASSLGLLLESADALAALREMGRVLRPGGRLLVEGMNGEDAVADFAERDGWTLEDGTEVRVRRRLDAAARVSHEVLRWEGPGGAGEKRHSLRLRGAAELEALVSEAGFTVEDVLGDWDGSPAEVGSERLIVVARRTGLPRPARRRILVS
jgi:SAM-dependent methyltransferase